MISHSVTMSVDMPVGFEDFEDIRTYTYDTDNYDEWLLRLHEDSLNVLSSFGIDKSFQDINADGLVTVCLSSEGSPLWELVLQYEFSIEKEYFVDETKVATSYTTNSLEYKRICHANPEISDRISRRTLGEL